jgi:hypothetical protein
MRYNAMVRVCERFRWGARTLHFFVDRETVDPATEYGRLLARAGQGPVPTPDEIGRAMRRRRPLVDAWSVKRQLIAGDVDGLVRRACRLGWRTIVGRRATHPTRGSAPSA